MKTVFLLLFVAFIGLVGHAQALSGAAATYEKSFWTNINKAKGLDYATQKSSFENAVTTASSNLKQLKKAAPDYKVEKHQAELDKLQATVNAANSAGVLAQDLKLLDAKMVVVRKATTSKDPYLDTHIYDAERLVKTLLEHTPSYDASAYQQELSSLRKDFESKNANAEKSLTDANKFRTAFENTFTSPDGLQAGELWDEFPPSNFEEIQKELKAYQAKIDAFLASDVANGIETNTSPNIKSLISGLKARASEVDSKIEKTPGFVIDGYKKEGIWNAYLDLKGYQAYWDGISRMLPSHEEFKFAKAKVDAALAKCGTMEQIEARRLSNYQAKLKTVTMEPATVRDAALEAEVKKAYLASQWGKGKNVIKVNLSTNQWIINHHEISGVVVSRKLQNCTVVIKDDKGNCWTDRYGIQQGKTDGGWGPSVDLYTYDQKVHILCENVK